MSSKTGSFYVNEGTTFFPYKRDNIRVKRINFHKLNEKKGYERLRNENFVGFSHFYLNNGVFEHTKRVGILSTKRNFINEEDAVLFEKLADLDSKLGTSKSEQLFACLVKPPGREFLQVVFNF